MRSVMDVIPHICTQEFEERLIEPKFLSCRSFNKDLLSAPAIRLVEFQ